MRADEGSTSSPSGNAKNASRPRGGVRRRLEAPETGGCERAFHPGESRRAGGRADGRRGGGRRAQRQPCWGVSRRQPSARAGSRGGLSVGGAAWERAGGHAAEPESPRTPARGSVTWPVAQVPPRVSRSNTVPADGQRFGRAASRGSSSPTTARGRCPAPLQAHHSHDPGERPRTLPHGASARGCAGWPRTRRVPHQRCRYDGQGDRRGPVRAGGIGRAVPGENHGGTASRGPENRQDQSGWAPGGCWPLNIGIPVAGQAPN